LNEFETQLKNWQSLPGNKLEHPFMVLQRKARYLSKEGYLNPSDLKSLLK
jgi:hypothetical protein